MKNSKFKTCLPSGKVQKILTISLVSVFCVLYSEPVHAMHIAEGILPFKWAALWFALALPFIAYGMKRLKNLSSEDISFKPLVGLMAAIVFVISLMPVPVPTAGTCSHPGGTAIPAILVGPSISVLIAGVALLLQALFFAHGGLSTWGAGVFSMGVAGAFVGFGTFRLLRKFNAGLGVSAFFAGMFSDWAIYFTTSVVLASGIRGDEPFWPLFSKILVAFIPTQLPLGLLEGAMTAGVVTLLYKRRADLLVKLGVITAEEAGGTV